MEQKGFTIIELMISIFILSVAIVGIYSGFSVVAIMSSNAADQLTASYLAQEGMEIVRNLRDNNWLSSDSSVNWYTGLDDCSGGCRADYKGPLLSNEIDNYLDKDAKGFFSYDACTEINPNCRTKFKRKITITCLPDGDCATANALKVVTQVLWDEKASVLNPGALQGSVLTEEILYNWYPLASTSTNQ